MSAKPETKERGWEKVQIKAFTSWLNGILSQRNIQINDIQTDLSDGVGLLNFLELLSGKKVGQKYDMKPASRIQSIQNLHIALQFLEKTMGIKPTASAEDFADQNLKMILGFLWSLFKKFRIQVIKHEDKSSEEGLLLWVKKTTEGYPDVNVETYKNSFRDGMAFLALCDKFIDNKETFDFSKFSKENQGDNLKTAFDQAEKYLGIPQLLDAQEVADGNIDERSLVLYISLYFHAFVAKQQQLAVQKEKDLVEERMKGLQGSLEERARLAQELQDDNEKLRNELEELRLQLKTERDAKNELQEKDTYLEEKVEVLKQLLEQENEEKDSLEKELEDLKGKLASRESELDTEKKKSGGLTEGNASLEQQVSSLQEQVSQLQAKLKAETEGRQSENEKRGNEARVELKGLEVLRKNLDEHVEDLNRWMKYLDFDSQTELDFGELRTQIYSDISKENFDEQLQYLSTKLSKENEEIVAFLKLKEIEAKAKKAKEKKKKEQQKAAN
eukprot:TRINITY_DN1992_c0_g1_i1.p1 TRINITY_DN1992_c0_g1~~TRINITY_DN1992_c0_g1_i1.p1  ORF type:complete len:501 (+),score=239.35 TRINITY_DN1992_c0_g1_i1:62-1564(+)